MNEMNIIQQNNVMGREIDVYGTAAEPMFLAKDVAEWIDYTKSTQGHYNVSKMLSTVDDDEKQLSSVVIAGQSRNVWFLTEDGLYEVFLQSRKPIAKQFKKQIKQMLKTIRVTGGYVAASSEEKFIDTYFPSLSEETKKAMVTDLNKKNNELQAEIERQKPKVLFANAVETSETSILVGQLAKIITQNGVKVGQNRLFHWLREHGYLGKTGAHRNEPTQYSVERGWFEVTERTVQNPDGSVRITRTTKVTGKGQVYFINKFLKEGN